MKISGFNNAVILLDKPEGKTSFELISEVRRITGIKKIGHCGTLDKFASGLMILCTGQATKLTRYFLESDKRYTGRIRIGIETDTCDVTGNVTCEKPFSSVDWNFAADTLSGFTGTISQIPPRYSALKVEGKRASDRMRSGEEVNLPAREVTIYNLSVTGYNKSEGTIDFQAFCSKGTYIRSIARDFGEKLGTGACLSELKRTASGHFSISQAASIEILRECAADLNPGEMFFVHNPSDVLMNFSSMIIDKPGTARVLNGALFERENVVMLKKGKDDFFVLTDEWKNLIAIAEIDIDKWLIKYNSVFN